MEVTVYSDASWDKGFATIAYWDDFHQTFYHSNKIACTTSQSAEYIAAYQALLESLRLPDVTKIILHTDQMHLQNLYHVGRRNPKSLGSTLLDNIQMLRSIYDDVEIEIKYADRRKDLLMRLVDMIAYRKSRGYKLKTDKRYKEYITNDHYPIHVESFERSEL